MIPESVSFCVAPPTGWERVVHHVVAAQDAHTVRARWQTAYHTTLGNKETPTGT